MSKDKLWSGKVWGVHLYSSDDKPILIGGGWDTTAVSIRRPAGLATTPVLFRTKKDAKAWCAAQQKEHSGPPWNTKWLFKPVRVLREFTVLK